MFLIAFKDYRHDNEITDKVMKVFLRSEIIHCELIFSDGKVASSDMYRGVGIYEEDKNRNHDFWEYYEIPWFYETEARKYVARKYGKPYNWAGIFGSMLYPVGLSNDGFCCADLCYVALCKSGMDLPHHDPESVSPDDLRIMIQKICKRYYPK
ncbi:hypothetical protein [Flectobacillus roseus]|uniref:Uncharacterized protein n=1 Tax=Flectobacillus roseus TaxID=502259 RepID=A0ABT6Y363_9BACT|nr:hypothetical protein [Flectobacillus roseus]MDI9857995.1 hypothetical protein [Flectobacillus roseus]